MTYPVEVGLSRHSTADELANLVRERIMRGDLAPDSPMREAALASRFEVSRRTVREALSILEHEGIVRHHRHKGSRVTRFDADDIHDLYEVRRTMELAAARAPSAPPHRQQALRDSFERLRAATTNGDSREIVSCDLGFHQAIVGLLDSARMDRFFHDTSVEMRYALSLLEASTQESRVRPAEALDEHRAIRDALLAGDSTTAQQLISGHIELNEGLLTRLMGGGA